MNKYKEAFQSAEQEIEEKSIEQLKLTIKAILQKKKDKEEKRSELDEEIKLLKQDIEDFKAGRLDKVKERHETNPIIQNIFPITINIIKQEIVTKPWTWVYEINPLHLQGNRYLSIVDGTPFYTTSSTSLIGEGTYTCLGTTAQTFSSGSYSLSGDGTTIVNL